MTTKKGEPVKRTPATKPPKPPAKAAGTTAASRSRNPARPPRKPGPGKDSALTLTRLSSITNVIAAGNYVTTACQFAGIGEGTFYRWRQRGELEVDRVSCLPRVNVDRIMESFEGKDPRTPDANGNPMERASAEWMWSNRPRQFDPVEWPYVVFTFLIERARAAAEIRTIQGIHKAAGQGNWQAGAWWLERTMPEKYGRRDHINLEGSKPGDPVRTETVVTVDTLNKKLAALLDD